MLHRPPGLLPLLLIATGLLTSCDSDGLRLQTMVELINRTGFSVEVFVGDTLKVSRLPNGGTAEFETSSGRRPIRVNDLATGLAIIEEQYRFDQDVVNRIDLQDARARLEIRHTGSCCIRVLADSRQVAELGGASMREVLIPAGTRAITIRSCAGVTRSENDRVFLPGETTIVTTTDADCDA